MNNLDKLIKQLESDVWETRRDAAKQLQGVEDERAVGALTKALNDPNVIVRRWAARSLGRVGTAPLIDPQDACVLVVEDNFNNFRLVARLLDFLGVKLCKWKTSGSQVVEFADSLSRVDLILMDIYLPGEDGYQALARLRAHPKLAHTRVVAVTAESTSENVLRACDAGFDGFIGKPLSTVDFPDQICRIFEGEEVWELGKR